MRDILEGLIAAAIGVLGTSFLLGVLVGVVFATVGRTGGGRRGVALPVKDEDPDAWRGPVRRDGANWVSVKDPERKH